jgi:divalent metal cation (Fe/Co/Zn/Cd) transporter
MPAVEHVNEVLTLHMGPNHVLLTISVDARNDLPAGDLEQAIEMLTREIKAAHPDVGRVFIEVEASRLDG